MSPSTAEVGCLVRRPFRRFLLANGVPFREERGPLDSLFVLRDATPQQVALVRRWVRSLKLD